MKRARRRRILAVGLSIMVAASAAVVWDRAIKDCVFPKRFGVVEAGSVYRSGQLSRLLVEDVLAEHQIGTIIFLSEDKAHRPDVEAEAAAARKLGIERLNFPIGGDGTGDINEYAGAIEAMVRAQRQFKPVLVHCHSGTQRTGAAIAFYRLLVQHREPDEVFAELREWKHDPTENPKLIPYVNEHLGELQRILAARGVIEGAPVAPAQVVAKR